MSVFRATDSEVTRFGRSLIGDGWSYLGRTSGGHHAFTHPSGGRITLPNSPRSQRWKAEARSRVRRTVPA